MLTYECLDQVATIRLDDGKANAISFEFVEQMTTALDQAEREAKAVIIVGREQRFCAGFDLTVMRDAQEKMINLVGAGARTLLRIFEFPRPVIAACTGHAVAGGALLLLACDARMGTKGNFKIGLNETANSMPLPSFGLELARAKLDPRYLDRAVLHSILYTPEEAVCAGFLDELSDPDELLRDATKRAQQLAQLPDGSYRVNKLNLYLSVRHAIADSLNEFES